jgi:hypothetical protein
MLMIGITMTYIILNNEPKQSAKLLSISTTYSYLYDEDQTIEVPLFINHKKHPLNHIDSYQSLYLSDENEQKRLEVSLKEIKKAHFESYLGEVYQLIILVLDLPYMDNVFEISECYLHLNLVNQETYQIMIGDFHMTYQESNTDALLWDSLYGIKAENTFLSRIFEIHIPYQTLHKDILSVSVGTSDILSFRLEDSILKIQILHRSMLLYDVPVIITYTDQSIQTIQNFRYIIDYQLLKESGPLVHIYALN